MTDYEARIRHLEALVRELLRRLAIAEARVGQGQQMLGQVAQAPDSLGN